MPEPVIPQAGQREEDGTAYDIRRLSEERDFEGLLTVGNAEAAAVRLQQLLAGRKFTVVSTWRMPHGAPVVNTSRELGGRVTAHVDGAGASVGFSDGGYSHILTTTVPHRVAGHALSYWEKRQRGTWLCFRRDRLEWEFCSASGHLIYMAAVVEAVAEG